MQGSHRRQTSRRVWITVAAGLVVALVVAIVLRAGGSGSEAADVPGTSDAVPDVATAPTEGAVLTQPDEQPVVGTEIEDLADPGGPAQGGQVEDADDELPVPEVKIRGLGLLERPSLADQVESIVRAQSIAPFRVAMLNILGSQHTAGSRPYDSGVARARVAAGVIANSQVSMVGFSEVQRDQLAVLRGRLPSFAFYPGETLGSRGVPQSVAWDTTVWELVEAHTFSIVFSSQVRPQPVVRLRNIVSGAEVWLVNVHNSPEGMESERDRAQAIEVSQINALARTGVPVVMTGDFNEKLEALCVFVNATPLLSAVGGGGGGAGCSAPPQRLRVDWIFATPDLKVEGYVVTRDAPVPYITDHALLISTLSMS